MTGHATRASVQDSGAPDRTADFAGAIYGSLLASSTILGTAASASGTVRSPELLVTLLATSVIYWLLHVYVDVVGRERPLRVAVHAMSCPSCWQWHHPL
jgi:hypothetical protein